MFTIRRSILKKLFTGILLSVLMMMTVTAFTIGYQAQTVLEQKARLQLSDKAKSSAEKVQNRVDQILASLTTFSSLYKHGNVTNGTAFDTFTEMMERSKDISELQLATPDGKFLTYPGSPTDENYDPRQSDWYKGAVQNQAAFVSDVFQYSKTEFPKIALSLPLFNNDEEVAGVIVAFVSVPKLSEFVENMRVGQTGYMFIVDRQGKLLAHPDKKYALSRPQLASIPAVAELMKGKSGINTMIKEGTLFFSAYQYNETLHWGIVVTQAAAEVQKDVYHLQGIILLISLVGMMLLSILLYGFVKQIVKPIKDVQNSMETFRSGDLDTRLTVKTQDELRLLADSFNGMSSKVRQIILKIFSVIGEVEEIAGQVASGSEQTCSMQNEVVTTTEALAREMDKQSKQLAHICDIVAAISSEIAIITESIGTAASYQDETSRQTEKAAESINLLQGSMGKVADDMNLSQTALGDLQRGIDHIGAILAMIEEISKKTKLLSLNARIEASRAGQAGLGFGVVADEIRQLSEHTEEATVNIREVISTIGERMNLVSSRMTETTRTAVDGRTILLSTSAVFAQIAATVVEVSGRYKEIEQFSRSILEQSNLIQQLINDLSLSSQEAVAATQQAAASTQESAAISVQFQANSQRMIGLVNELRDEVNYFKTAEAP